MIEISFYVLLIIYCLVVASFIVFAIFNLYHLFNFGFLSFLSFLMTFIFLAGAILILFITYTLAVPIDWSQTIII
jgi:hypothetical protein